MQFTRDWRRCRRRRNGRGQISQARIARGELHMIGATTLDEYRKHIEKDGALERRFQPIVVKTIAQRHHCDIKRPESIPRKTSWRVDPVTR